MQTPVISKVPPGVGAPPPPGMDLRKGKGKLMCIRVRMLDNTISVFHLGHKATGQALFDEVCRHLNLLESDYFGLEFIDGYGHRCWLDKDKSILRQISSTQTDARFYFILKFYTPNPTDLEEEYTRYLVCLQIRRDLASGEFICNENTAALLASFIVQAECGDFSAEDYPDHTYLSVTIFVPNQTVGFQIKVMENHKKLIGMSPADADLALLETARRCDFYGIKLYLAKDIEGTDVSLAVAHMGIRVFHQLSCVSTFSWAKIRKLSFKRKRLMIKLHPEKTIEFNFENRNDCKNFWKKCVEHHAFFRCMSGPIPEQPKKESKLFSRGSSFRYYGRTQKQLIDYVREHHKRREPFQRPIRMSSSAQRSGTSSTIPPNRHIQFNMDGERYATVLRNPDSVARFDTAERRQQQSCAVHFPHQNRNGFDKNGYNGTMDSDPIQNNVVYQDRHFRSAHHTKMGGREATRATSDDRQYNSDLESSSVVAVVESSQNGRLEKSKRTDENKKIRSSNSPPAVPDQMSVSMPNVLAEDLKVLCREFELRNGAKPPKSASGEDFREDQLGGGSASISTNPKTIHGGSQSYRGPDNLSEGSYRLADPDYSSSQSDVGSSSCGVVTLHNPRVYSTNFTTKRVGNVIVKRVIDSNNPGIASDSRETNKVQLGDIKSSYPHKSVSTYSKPNNNNGEDSDDCSSAYSDFYCKSSVSAPAAASISGTSYGRNGGATATTMANRLRNAMPIQIDGPPQTFNDSPPSSSATKIIRPVVLPNPGETDFSKPALSGRSTISNSGFNVTSDQYKPIVHGIKSTFEKLNNQIISDIYGDKASLAQISAPLANEEDGGSPTPGKNEQTHGARAPYPGRVIQKSSLVITPEGIGLKEDLIKQSKPQVPPKILPKPTNIHLLNSLHFTEITALDSNKKVVNEVSTPFNLILSNAKDLCQVTTSTTPTQISTTTSVKTKELETQNPQVPAMISVENVDRPNLKTVYLFGGATQIPYTLKVRNRNEISTPETSTKAQDDKQHKQQQSAIAGTSVLRLKKGIGERGHRKSLELVNRKRLPSQDSFSSQDHSISPTSPDSGNIMEYMLRRRSLSNDRYPIKTPLNETKSIAGTSAISTPEESAADVKKLRNSERRKTVPVHLQNLTKNVVQSMDEASNNVSNDEKAKKPTPNPKPIIKKQNHDDGGESSSGELPEPPPPLQCIPMLELPVETKKIEIVKQILDTEIRSDETPEAVLTTQILKGVLETDF